jgi:hypothetical protein
MKTNLKFALCAFVLVLITAGCCDCKKSEKDVKNYPLNGEYISGQIKIDASDKVTAHIEIMVRDQNFKVYTYKIINYKGYKAIAIQYKHSTDNNQYDDDVNYSMEYDLSVDNTFVDDDNNNIKWKSGDKIRVIPINDEYSNVHENLKDYYRNRMAYFENETANPYLLEAFNTDWNYRNPLNKVKTFMEKKPRLAKGDIILGIQ